MRIFHYGNCKLRCISRILYSKDSGAASETKGGFYMKTKKMTWLALLALILTLAFPSAALSGRAAGTTYRVTVSSGYLALRNERLTTLPMRSASFTPVTPSSSAI